MTKGSFRRAGLPLAIMSASLALFMACTGFVYVRQSQDEGQLARNAINRTNQVLLDAQNSVRARRHYTGNLAFAYSNQQYARELYGRSEYHSAIEYTLYARRLAYQALDANGPRYGRGRYDDESRFHSRSDGQLREDMRRAHPEGPTDDRAVLSLNFQFGI
jgi:hypothetical protein